MTLSTRTTRRSPVYRLAALAAAGSLVLAACGDENGDDNGDDNGAAEENGDTEDPTNENGDDAPAAEAPDVEAGDRDLTLEIGTVLPQTGSLAFLGPPEEAGVLLAAEHINDADMGITVEVTLGDSGDAENRAYATTVQQHISAGVDVVLGAASSGVSTLFIDEVVAADILMISPANTSPDFTTWDDNGLYFRTAPSDLLQGEVLGNEVAADGVQNLALLVLNDPYGTGLEEVLTETFEATGGSVVATESFNAGDTTFDAQISSLLAADPEAIVLITFDEIYTVVPALDAQGFDMSAVYLVDGNIADFSGEFPDGMLEGAKGTQPGPDLGDSFRDQLNEVWNDHAGEDLTDFNYAAESYDAVMLVALAALAANSTDGPDIAEYMQMVSGGSGDGETTTDFAEAAQALIDGNHIDWDGPSGPITFDEHGDPTEATIGIFEYDGTNSLVRTN